MDDSFSMNTYITYYRTYSALSKRSTEEHWPCLFSVITNVSHKVVKANGLHCIFSSKN